MVARLASIVEYKYAYDESEKRGKEKKLEKSRDRIKANLNED